MATTYNNLYLDIRQQLRRAGIEEATLEARELVCFGTNKSREELARRIEDLSPSIFFSSELCAHYFTYMNKQNGAHFILFDDAASIRKKLYVARSLDISDVLLPYPDVADILDGILA